MKTIKGIVSQHIRPLLQEFVSGIVFFLFIFASVVNPAYATSKSLDTTWQFMGATGLKDTNYVTAMGGLANSNNSVPTVSGVAGSVIPTSVTGNTVRCGKYSFNTGPSLQVDAISGGGYVMHVLNANDFLKQYGSSLYSSLLNAPSQATPNANGSTDVVHYYSTSCGFQITLDQNITKPVYQHIITMVQAYNVLGKTLDMSKGLTYGYGKNKITYQNYTIADGRFDSSNNFDPQNNGICTNSEIGAVGYNNCTNYQYCMDQKLLSVPNGTTGLYTIQKTGYNTWIVTTNTPTAVLQFNCGGKYKIQNAPYSGTGVKHPGNTTFHTVLVGTLGAPEGNQTSNPPSPNPNPIHATTQSSGNSSGTGQSTNGPIILQTTVSFSGAAPNWYEVFSK